MNPSPTLGGSVPSEDVAAQLRDIERQGGGMARFAHVCAGLLLVAGSLGSLISISAEAFRHFLTAAGRGQLDLPDLLNAVVGVLLVLAGDAALLYAASMLRVLRSAQAPREEAVVHLYVMWGVSVLEAGTYLYMAYLFDRPTNIILWLIDVGRAIAWPLLCAYLSMARPLPVGPRDIMYHSALASGKGVVRDIATLSADPSAPLHHKVRIFRAAANMTAADRAKLDTLVSELTLPSEPEREPFPLLAPAPFTVVPETTGDDFEDTMPPMAQRIGERAPQSRPRADRNGARNGSQRVRLSEAQQRALAFSLLDQNPQATRDEIAKFAQCRVEKVAGFRTAWQAARNRSQLERDAAFADDLATYAPTTAPGVN